jgi:hypothetical protein
MGPIGGVIMVRDLSDRTRVRIANKSETKTTWRAGCRYRPGLGCNCRRGIGLCGRAVVAAGVAAVACAAGGWATHENSMFTAADCDAQRQKFVIINIEKYFRDKNT